MQSKAVTRTSHQVLVTALSAGLLAVVAVALGVVAHRVRPLTVLTGSMKPTFPPGTVVFDEAVPASNIAVGDVITFQMPSSNSVVTHRVVRIVSTPQGREAITRGDANNVEDSWRVHLSGKVWRERFHIPAIGYAGNWISRHNPLGPFSVVIAALGGMAIIHIWRKDGDERGAAHA